MKYCIRPMVRQDIPQVTEIDREAFPTQAPPADYRHEIDNRLAHYIVASSDDYNHKTAPGTGGLTALTRKLKRALGQDGENAAIPSPPRPYLLGFAGFWILADEAHITSIAVREKYRGYGVGEMLLASLIDLAAKLNASDVTLEVRLTNTGAQALYTKYGFVKVGVRPGYYTDNSEDAVLMTVDEINLPAVQQKLRDLKDAHARRWGTTFTAETACVTLPPGL